MLNTLEAIANNLDSKGRKTEADMIDSVIKRLAQPATHLIYVEELNIPAMKMLRTDVRISDTAQGTVVEAKAFQGKGKLDPEVQQYVNELKVKYPGAKVQ